jgi:hypothetical protein
VTWASIDEIAREFGLEAYAGDRRAIRRELLNRLKDLHPGTRESGQFNSDGEREEHARIISALEGLEALGSEAAVVVASDGGIQPLPDVAVRSAMNQAIRELDSGRLLRLRLSGGGIARLISTAAPVLLAFFFSLPDSLESVPITAEMLDRYESEAKAAIREEIAYSAECLVPLAEFATAGEDLNEDGDKVVTTLLRDCRAKEVFVHGNGIDAYLHQDPTPEQRSAFSELYRNANAPPAVSTFGNYNPFFDARSLRRLRNALEEVEQKIWSRWYEHNHVVHNRVGLLLDRMDSLDGDAKTVARRKVTSMIWRYAIIPLACASALTWLFPLVWRPKSSDEPGR